MLNIKSIVTCALLTFASNAIATAPEQFTIYLDADRTAHFASARAIEMGVKTAFAEQNNLLNQIPVKFKVVDHRGNVVRSKRHMDQFSRDQQGIAFFAGLHSPPLIKYRDYINEQGLLVLVPWAAGGPITRYPSTENYVFRLSVDDTKVGAKLVETAIAKGCRQIDLLLEQTPWGKSNYQNMSNALKKHTDITLRTTWFSWGINEPRARVIASELSNVRSECVLFVGNSTEGGKLIQALSDVVNPPKIFSHWGITGGKFPEQIPFATRQKVALTFIQSCFNFASSDLNALQAQVLQRAKTIFPDDIQSGSIAAPAGFVHGYDLAKLLIQAAENIKFSDDIASNRTLLKQALESINEQVQGLVKTYQQPFSIYQKNNQDAHEALTGEDLCMAVYNQDNAVILSAN